MTRHETQSTYCEIAPTSCLAVQAQRLKLPCPVYAEVGLLAYRGCGPGPTLPRRWRRAAAGYPAIPRSLPLGGKVAIGMIGSMTRQKIAITLPEEQVAVAQRAVAEGRAASVSAYISQALARRDTDDELAEAIAEIYAESGEPTEDDRQWARRVL